MTNSVDSLGSLPASQDSPLGASRTPVRNLNLRTARLERFLLRRTAHWALLELLSACSIVATPCRGCRPFSAEKEPLALSPGATNPWRSLVSHEKAADEISARTPVRNLNLRTARLERFALLVSVDSLTSFSPSANAPLGHHSDRSPLHCRCQCFDQGIQISLFQSQNPEPPLR